MQKAKEIGHLGQYSVSEGISKIVNGAKDFVRWATQLKVIRNATISAMLLGSHSYALAQDNHYDENKKADVPSGQVDPHSDTSSSSDDTNKEPIDNDICDNIGFEKLQYVKDGMWAYPIRLDEERKLLDAQGNPLGAGLTQVGWVLAVGNDIGEYYIIRPVAGLGGGIIGEAQRATYNSSRGIEGVAGGIMGSLEGAIFKNGNDYDNGSEEAKGTISRILRGASGVIGGIAGTAEGIIFQNENGFDKGYKDADHLMDNTLLWLFNPNNNFEKGWKDADQFAAYLMDGVFGGNSNNAFNSYLLQLKLDEAVAVPYCMEDNELAGHFKLIEILAVDVLPWLDGGQGGGNGGGGEAAPPQNPWAP